MTTEPEAVERIKAALSRRPRTVGIDASVHESMFNRLSGALMGIIDDSRTLPETAERIGRAVERAVNGAMADHGYGGDDNG